MPRNKKTTYTVYNYLFIQLQLMSCCPPTRGDYVSVILIKKAARPVVCILYKPYSAMRQAQRQCIANVLLNTSSFTGTKFLHINRRRCLAYLFTCSANFCPVFQRFRCPLKAIHATCTASRFLGVACLYRSWRGGTMRSRRHLWRNAATAPTHAASISTTIPSSAGCIRKLTNWTVATPGRHR